MAALRLAPALPVLLPVCRVERGTCARISWRSGKESDFFHYDPFLEVMAVARPPAPTAPSAACPAR